MKKHGKDGIYVKVMELKSGENKRDGEQRQELQKELKGGQNEWNETWKRTSGRKMRRICRKLGENQMEEKEWKKLIIKWMGKIANKPKLMN